MKNSFQVCLFASALCGAASFTGLVGCASSANTTAATKKAWSTDQYVSAEGADGTQANAARILAGADKPCDRVMQVGSSFACVHKDPAADSAVVGTLPFESAVRVVAEGQFIRKPGTSDMNEFAQGDTTPSDTTPTWVKVEAGDVSGWLPARCLFDPMAMGTPSMSSDEIKAAAGAGGKGFSEKMKYTPSAMKGAAGTPVMKDANYPAADKVIASCAAPLPFAARASEAFEPSCDATNVKYVGNSLCAVSPEMGRKVNDAAILAEKAPTLAEKVDQLGGLLGAVGVSKEQAEQAKMIATVADLILEMTKESPLTPNEERLLGYECLATCLGNDKVLESNHELSNYVRWIGAKLAANSSMPYPSIGYAFVVVDDDQTVNAMAIPGGPIIITTGMLRFLDSESELAVILAHEIAHVEERHGIQAAEDAGAKQLIKLMEFGELVVSGKIDGFLNDALKSVPDSLRPEAVKLVKTKLTAMLKKVFTEVTIAMITEIRSGSNQSCETAADLRGMSLARAAGWNPEALQPVLDKLAKLTGGYGGASYSSERLSEAKEVVVLLPTATADSPECAARWSQLDGFLPPIAAAKQ